MKKKFSGVVVPMITPLTKNKAGNTCLKIDTEAVSRIMKVFAENDISPLILGTTGESSSIGCAESLVFIRTAVEIRQSNQMVYAGLVGNNVAELHERAKLYADAGVDAVVSTLPSYYILTPQQMENYYLRLADATPCPVLIYNIKATTQMSIPLEVIERLSQHPNIAGLKDSERDEERLKLLTDRYRYRADFSFFCGWGAKSLESLQLGADGIVPSTGNVVPELYKTMIDAFKSGNMALAEEMQQKTDEVALQYQQGRTLGQSLAVLKAMMRKRNLCESCMMPPLNEIDQIQTT